MLNEQPNNSKPAIAARCSRSSVSGRLQSFTPNSDLTTESTEITEKNPQLSAFTPHPSSPVISNQSSVISNQSPITDHLSVKSSSPIRPIRGSLTENTQPSPFNGQETMRIDEEEKEALNDALEDINGEVYLFGSRTDDNAKGGDIDILIITSDDPFEVSRKVTVDFTMKCDEKIDVIAVPVEGQSNNERNFLKNLATVRLK